MVLSSLSEKLQSTFQKLKGRGKLSEKDVEKALREVKIALLEADVNFKVVKNFLNIVKERCIGQEVLTSLTPGQQVVKIVHEELTNLMGGEQKKLNFDSSPGVIMLAGLQGSGKTTSAAKLAKYLSKNYKPLLVALDIYRPAAIKQLEVLGNDLSIPVFSMGQQDPVKIAKAALKHAKKEGRDLLILDTAGRLHINEELMEELASIKENVKPSEILLVVDSMTGQDAVNVAQSFNERLGITGVILTKLDGDTRGGAALSVKEVTKCPIKFVGLGEKTDAFEPFHPDRLASRILGMGDMLSLIEKAQANVDQDKAKLMEKKIRSQEFTLEDFLDQLDQVKSMGPLDQIMEMIPGMGKAGKKMKNMNVDDDQLVKIEAVINSMTKKERREPSIINSSRKKRIAAGSGTRVQDVNQLLKQFAQMQKMLKQFSDMERGKVKGLGKFPFM